MAETYCRAAGGVLPVEDGLLEIAPGRQVVKDLSGLPDRDTRATTLNQALGERGRQSLVCANEGVLRDAISDIADDDDAAATLEEALRKGAASQGPLTVINVNRQRPTADELWPQILDYVTREELWSGCADCPFNDGGCSMRSNAEQLRRREVREQLRTLLRLGTGEAVPTLREVFAILSWAVVGDQSCARVKKDYRDRGATASTAADGYFGRVLGGGLVAASAERSPLLDGIKRSGLGSVSDLEVDAWLRDASGAPYRVREISGDPAATRPELSESGRLSGMAGSTSPLDRVRTAQGEMTFHALGEMVSTDEDPTRVEDGLDALVRGDVTNAAAETLWRQRLYFEAAEELGGPTAAARRLLDYRHTGDLVALAKKAATGEDTILELNEIVLGLNFLVTGFSSPNEGLVVPDPACLFARDPGSFRLARPSLVHGQVPLEALSVSVPDRGIVEEVLDVDHVDVELVVADQDEDLSLRISPRMYEAIREGAEFKGPVGQGVAEMNDLRGFYGRLSAHINSDGMLRVADPDSVPPALVTITLPHFVGRGHL